MALQEPHKLHGVILSDFVSLPTPIWVSWGHIPSKLPVFRSLSQSWLLGSQASDTSLRLDAGHPRWARRYAPSPLGTHSGQRLRDSGSCSWSPRGGTRTFSLSDTCTHKSKSKEIPLLTLLQCCPFFYALGLKEDSTECLLKKKNLIRPLQTKKTGMQKVIFPGMWEGDWGRTFCSQSEGTRGQLSRWDYVVEDEKRRVQRDTRADTMAEAQSSGAWCAEEMEKGGKDSPINPPGMQPNCGWERPPSLLDLTTASLPGVRPPPSSPCLLPWDATGDSRPNGKMGRGTWVGLMC